MPYILCGMVEQQQPKQQQLHRTTVEVVAHCWNYSRLATLFLSQFLLHPPRTPTTVTVCYSADDKPTIDVLHFFWWERKMRGISSVAWNWYEMPTPKLLRRAIGRNERALATDADFVLFADVDYLLGPGAVDAIVERMTEACGDGHPKLCFPRTAGWSGQKEGDALIESIPTEQNLLRVIEVNSSIFLPTRMGKAIGGCQWLPGDISRRFGYVDASSKFLRPVNVWRRTFEDSAARKHWVRNGGVSCLPIDVPNVWRIRHSKRGRFDVGVKL